MCFDSILNISFPIIQVTLRRASALLRGQRIKNSKKTRTTKAKKE